MKRRTFSWAIVLLLILVGPEAVQSVSAAPPVPPPESTSAFDEDVTFESGSVDVWESALEGGSWQFLNAEWSEGGSASVTTNVVGSVDFNFDGDGCDDDLLFCFINPGNFVSLIPSTAKIGFDSDASVAGHIRLSALTTKLQGTAEITYPGTVSIGYPSADSFLAGQTVNLGGDWTLGAGATIDASQTGGNFQLDGDFRVAGLLDVTGYFPFSSDSARIYDIDGSDQVTLFALTAFEGTPEVPPLPILGFGGSLGPYRVNPDDVTVDTDGVIIATGTDKFSNFIFDLDAIAASPLYGIGAPTLGVNVNLQDLGIPLDLVLGYDIFDADAHIDFTASQTLTFNPSISIKLSFDPPPAGITGPYESKASDNSWVIFAPGEQVGIEFPPGRRDPIDVTPQVLLDSTLHNQSSLATNSLIQLKAGRFDYQIPSFEIFPEFGPFDTGLDFVELHGDVKWDETHIDTSTHHHDSICFPCTLDVHSSNHNAFHLFCAGTCNHTHSSDKYHHLHVDTTTHHHDSFSFGRIFHLHNVTTHFHDINIGPFGPWGFPGLDVSQDPVWGPEDYAENPGPPFSLSDDTLELPFTPINLSSFLLEPNDPPVADPGGPYEVSEGSAVELSALASSDEEGDPMTFAWDLDDDGSFETLGVEVSFAGIDGPADHTVTVQVCDPYSCTEDSVNVHVNNVAPNLSISAPAVVLRNDAVVLSGTWTDPGIHHDNPYSWALDYDGGAGGADSGTASYGDSIVRTTSYALEGFYIVTFDVTDKDGGHGSTAATIEVKNRPPDCSDAGPSIDTIWPPSHKMVAVNIVGVTDEEGDPITITIDGIFQDEPLNTTSDGNTEIDGDSVGTDTALVRAERAGSKKVPGNGRVYYITYTADDGHGGQCSDTVEVGVPHDQGKQNVPVGDGPLFDSTVT